MFLPSSNIKVYLAMGSTDMRKSINGLSVLVSGHLEFDPFSGHLFVFLNEAIEPIIPIMVNKRVTGWNR